MNEPSYLIDGVHSTAAHHDVLRIVFSRLDARSETYPVVELIIPPRQLPAVIKALMEANRWLNPPLT